MGKSMLPSSKAVKAKAVFTICMGGWAVAAINLRIHPELQSDDETLQGAGHTFTKCAHLSVKCTFCLKENTSCRVKSG